VNAIDRLAAMPQIVRALVSGRTAEELLRRAAGDSFSLHENVWHLRDIDVDAYEPRVLAILSQEHPFLPDVDGAKLARERDYHAQPLAPALEAFAASRARSVARLRALPEEVFERTAELEGAGRVTLRELLERWLDHDAGHVLEMEAL
jgi:DinB superfamily